MCFISPILCQFKESGDLYQHFILRQYLPSYLHELFITDKGGSHLSTYVTEG